jgi:hypothetical protein
MKAVCETLEYVMRDRFRAIIVKGQIQKRQNSMSRRDLDQMIPINILCMQKLPFVRSSIYEGLGATEA